MEDNIQRVFTILISVVIFFLLPLYMAFEKKDDISYALALKITTAFVDEVTNKGYLTEDMYSDYISNLQVTSNTYNVSFEHIAKKYYPVINTYNTVKYAENGPEYSELNGDYFDFQQYKENYIANQSIIKEKINKTIESKGKLSKMSITDWIYTGPNNDQSVSGKINNYTNLKLSYRLQEEKHYTDEIIKKIEDNSSNNRYCMNQGDEFTVIIKNENTTIATVLFNSLTFGANSGNDTKVYINYGGSIKNMDWLDAK